MICLLPTNALQSACNSSFMKVAIGLLLFFLHHTGFPQNGINFIFVDFHQPASIYGPYEARSLSDLKSKVLSLSESLSGDQVLFMSNGYNPIVQTAANKFEESLEQMYTLTPTSPDPEQDLRLLDSLLGAVALPTDLLSLQAEVKASATFHFFLSGREAEQGGFEEFLIREMLLANRLCRYDASSAQSWRMQAGIRVVIYLDKDDRLKSTEYENRLQNDYGYEIQRY